ERYVGAFAVDFGGGSRDDKLALFGGRFEDHLRAVDVGLDGTHGTFDDQLDADGGGKMDDCVGIVHEFSDELAIFDSIQVILELGVRFQMADIVHAAGGQIVEEH